MGKTGKDIMSDAWKPLAVGFGIVFAIVLLFGIMLGVALYDSCNDELTEVHISPDKKLVLVIYTRDCGATTPCYTYVSVGKASGTMKVPRDLETVCVTKDNASSTTAKWLGPDTIAVYAPRFIMDYKLTAEPKTSVTVVYREEK